MGNSRNKKGPKKSKASKSKCQNTSEQKENVPKTEKNKAVKTNPNDGIAMSKQLMLKKNNVRAKRQSSRISERICPNGKPIPSLAELEKMFEDSDEDDEAPKPPSTPKKQTSTSDSEKNLLSPSTISKISERVMGLIENISDPKELLEEVTPLLDTPPPPVIPPKKRKKPDVPYIVGCKDRPKVIRKPNVNFCKGDDDYGIIPSAGNEPDEPQKKRAKPSNIPNYSKSIFNAHSDEIAERLTKEDTGTLSDASVDSNKTIEYDPTPFHNARPHSFSPLPSTSTDNKTFIKNDELFNESLKEMNEIKEATERKVKTENSNDEIEDEVNIIDMPYETIVIDDVVGNKTARIQNTCHVLDTSVIEIIEPENLDPVKPKNNIRVHNTPCDEDEDCIVVPSSKECGNQKLSNEPILIDDEYSTINMDIMDTYNNEPIEIIDIDDIIAENQSVLNKFKNNGVKELNKINTVVNVPTTYNTTPQTPAKQTANDNVIRIDDNIEPCSQNNQTTSQQISHSEPTVRSTVSPPDNQTEASVPLFQRSRVFLEILKDFFTINPTVRRNVIPVSDERTQAENINNLFAQVAETHQSNSSNRITMPSLLVNTSMPVSTYTSDQRLQQAVDNRQRDQFNLSPASSSSSTQQTSSSLPQNSPTPSRNLGDCPICLEPLMSKGIASTICGHVFCLSCIQTAIKSNGKKCPTCRKALKGAGGGYHQLFL